MIRAYHNFIVAVRSLRLTPEQEDVLAAAARELAADAYQGMAKEVGRKKDCPRWKSRPMCFELIEGIVNDLENRAEQILSTRGARPPA